MGYEWVLIAVSFGVVTGLVGKSKGGSFLLWFVIGTVLPGTRSRRGHPVPATRTGSRNAAVRTAATRVKLYVQICPRCGEELYLPDPSEVRMPAPKRRLGDPR